MKTDYIELSKMTEEKKENYLKGLSKMYVNDSALGLKLEKPTENFNDYGLKFSSDYLTKINIAVVGFPIEIMKDYADEITVNMVKNEEDMLIPNENFDINNINATAIGNVAYIILNTKNEDLKNGLKTLLNKIYNDYMKLIEDFQNNIARC